MHLYKIYFLGADGGFPEGSAVPIRQTAWMRCPTRPVKCTVAALFASAPGPIRLRSLRSHEMAPHP